MCGVTTGGQEDCHWDCDIVTSDCGILITNPECLLDCYPEVLSSVYYEYLNKRYIVIMTSYSSGHLPPQSHQGLHLCWWCVCVGTVSALPHIFT